MATLSIVLFTLTFPIRVFLQIEGVFRLLFFYLSVAFKNNEQHFPSKAIERCFYTPIL